MSHFKVTMKIVTKIRGKQKGLPNMRTDAYGRVRTSHNLPSGAIEAAAAFPPAPLPVWSPFAPPPPPPPLRSWGEVVSEFFLCAALLGPPPLAAVLRYER